MVSRFLQISKFQPYPDYESPDSPGWQLMEAIVKRFAADAAPTPVLLVPIPDSFFYRTAPLDPVYQKRFSALAEPEHGLHVADVTTPLKLLSDDEKARLPFKHDFHFSPYGNERMAQFLMEELLKRDLLPVRAGKGPDLVTISPNGKKQANRPDTYILGISCFYHNSAASLAKNGHIIAAAEEERFSRIKHDRNFPHRAINYCLEEAGIQQSDLSAVVYYDNAYQTFERLMHTQLAIGAGGEDAWLRVIPSWLQQKLSIPILIRRYMNYDGPVLQEAHHRSHAASAFYPSPFQRAAILTVDGVGEWATASISVGQGHQITMLKEMHFPHSVGLLYSAFTQFVGFKVNNGEYKMMGLAPYGEPKYVDLIYEHLVDLKEDGSIELNPEYFAFLSEPRMTSDKFAELFRGPARHPDEPITQREMDIARSIQVVTEEIILRMAQHAYELTGEKYLCLAGGVALNCVANGRLLREGPFQDIWIQPAAGDAGCALGAALDVWHTYYNKSRQLSSDGRPAQRGSYWGPDYSAGEIRAFLDTFGYPYQVVDEKERANIVARFIEEGKVVGHFSGRLEYGPRALGSRSILGDARNQEMQTTINLKIKYRESFRPFAPSVLAECVNEYFDLNRESPYMLLVAQVHPDRCLEYDRSQGQTLFEIVRQPRSDVPAITHVDYSARIQSVHQGDHPTYYDVINAFRQRTGYGVIVNTSFNVRGEPIVCSPFDAYRCFMRTEMDVLIMGDFLLLKERQPEWPEAKGHLEEYDPDAVSSVDEGPTITALRRIFHEDFLPLAMRSENGDGRRISFTSQRVSTNWIDYPAGQSTEKIFDIPLALSADNPDPVNMAEAMMQYWQNSQVNRALLPVVKKLLELGCREMAISEDEEIVEDVSEFVYVMY
jgi:carbamoyltransferase